MNQETRTDAERFLTEETEFHLGFLPTEQSNPLTRTMEADFRASTAAGVRTLQRPEQDVLAMARKMLRSTLFANFVAAGARVVRRGGRIVFSGCGATGRLSILLESMWRTFCFEAQRPEYENALASIMTGGDFALMKSVEAFEDYQNFGRQQVAELAMGPDDMLVAITEGGETSSVIGTAKEAAERGCAVYLMYNNPTALLREKLVRCREVIDDPRITLLDLCCGPMALAGSTRMQATTSEQLIAGAFLESVLADLDGRQTPDFVGEFERVLQKLSSDESVRQLAEWIDFEVGVYLKNGRITYLANDYLLDIFTDTTERSPTFMLPPFRRSDDQQSPLSWAFVKNPLYSTRETWYAMLHREPRCLAWDAGLYRRMEAPAKVIDQPPAIDAEALYRYEVGSEPAPERFAQPDSCAILVEVAGARGNQALAAAAERYPVRFRFSLDSGVADSPLHLQNHMALKLALNTVSTGTMVKLGRVAGNWMSWVSISNKKLIDRAIRLIAELGEISYREACYALFESVELMRGENWSGREVPSPVQYTLQRLGRK